jgi:hypothetical protein
VLLLASTVEAQTPGFTVRLIDTVDQDFGDEAGGHDAALEVLNGTTSPEIEFDGKLNYPYVDFRQTSGGRFPTDQLLPDFRPLDTDRNNYIMEATADVTIPAGSWAIGFGSDDGGALRLEADSFEFEYFHQHDGEETPVDQFLFTPPFDQFDTIPRKATRGHNWSWATFSNAAPLTARLTASMNDNAGGDNWEIAITPFDEAADIGTDADPNAFNRTPAPPRGWELLQDGAFGWSVTTTETPSRQIAVGGDAGLTNEVLPGTLIDAEYGGGGAVVPGLLQRFYAIGNSANVRNTFPDSVRNELTVTTEPFTADPSWWSGSDNNIPGIPKYDQRLIDEGGFTPTNHDNYTAFLEGEILFERNGAYRFRDAVDDFTFLAIDTDESGVPGDNPDEILLSDNDWSNIRGNRSGAGVVDDNASPEAVVEITGVGADGKWLPIYFGISEGGGGDRGVLMWDYDVATQTPGGNADFPLEGEGVAANNLIQNVMVPNSHLRATLPDALQSGIRELILGEFPVAGNDIVFTFEVNSELLKSDRILVENRTPDITSTRIDFSGATIAIEEVGEMIPGDRFKLAEADEITGGDQVTFVFDDPSQWDTSQFASRAVIEYAGGGASPLDCNGDGVVDGQDVDCWSALGDASAMDQTLAAIGSLRGDADFDGGVGFPDFVILSNNWEQDPAVFSEGDFDASGAVGFADFVELSNNWEQSGAKAAVPEPSAWALLAAGGLLLGRGASRRRRGN